MRSLLPPCAYQGGKQRIAKEIVDYIVSRELIYPSANGTKIFDLCCGSGAITLEFINRGVHPSNITMCDKGSWGTFWKLIGDGTFSINTFREYCKMVPRDKAKVKDFLIELSKQSATIDEAYVYILLQAGAFGGKQIYREGTTWKNASFRSYWQPTETSNRRSPVNPMQPSIDELFDRVLLIAERCKGLRVVDGDIKDVCFGQEDGNGIVYIDPPYENSTGYGVSEFNIHDTLSWMFDETTFPIYVSEMKPLSDDEFVKLNFNGAKSGISGKRKRKHDEYLSVFR